MPVSHRFLELEVVDPEGEVDDMHEQIKSALAQYDLDSEKANELFDMFKKC